MFHEKKKKIMILYYCIMRYSNTVKPKIIQTPDIIFDMFLLMGAGH